MHWSWSSLWSDSHVYFQKGKTLINFHMWILTPIQVANVRISESRIMSSSIYIEGGVGFIPYQTHRTVDRTKRSIITNQYLSNWRD